MASGDALEGQLARGAGAVEGGRGEGHLTERLDVEEVGGPQVAVTLLVAGVDRVQVDGRLRAGLLQRGAGGQGPLEGGELAADLAHQVADGEAHLGVARVDVPGAGDDVGAEVGVDAHAGHPSGRGPVRVPHRVTSTFNYSPRASIPAPTGKFSVAAPPTLPPWGLGRKTAGSTATSRKSWRAYIMGTELLQHRLDRELREEHDISFSEYEILVRLSEADDGRMRMAILADSMSHSRSRVTHTIARMEKAGLVYREASRSDGRGVEAVMTDEGRRTPGRRRAHPRARCPRAPRRPVARARTSRPSAGSSTRSATACSAACPRTPTSADLAERLSRGSGDGGSRGADGRPRHRGARSCSPRRRRSCPRTRTSGRARPRCPPTPGCASPCGRGTTGRAR